MAITITRVEKRKDGRILIYLPDGSSVELASIEVAKAKAARAHKPWDVEFYAAVMEMLRTDPRLERPQDHAGLTAERKVDVVVRRG